MTTTLAPALDGPGLVSGAEPRATIVFVHGAWHGPWCWQAWIDAARDGAFATTAAALPGHDRPGSSRRIWNPVRSYVEHVRGLVEAIDGPVVIVAHSMGGYVTQLVLEHAPDNVAGAVLVASVPTTGVAPTVARLLRRHPGPTLRGILTADLYQLCRTEALTRRLLFSRATPAATVSACHARLQNESYLAFPAMLLRLPRPDRATVPVMVLAAEDDALFSVRAQRRLARAYATSLQLVPGGHDVMLDITSTGALHLVLDWIRRTLR